MNVAPLLHLIPKWNEEKEEKEEEVEEEEE